MADNQPLDVVFVEFKANLSGLETGLRRGVAAAKDAGKEMRVVLGDFKPQKINFDLSGLSNQLAQFKNAVQGSVQTSVTQVEKGTQAIKGQTSSISQHYREQANTLRNLVQAGVLSQQQGEQQAEKLKNKLTEVLQVAQKFGASSTEISRFSQALANASRTLATLQGGSAPLSFGDQIKRQLQGIEAEYQKLRAEAQQSGQANVNSLRQIEAELMRLSAEYRAAGNVAASELNRITRLQVEVARQLRGAVGDIGGTLGNLGAALGGTFAGGQIVRGLADAAREADKARLSTLLFQNVMARFGQDIPSASQKLNALADKFGLLDIDAQEAAITIVRSGATIQQAVDSLTGGAASALAKGQTAFVGFKAIAETFATQTSRALNEIGIPENIGPELLKLESRIKGLTEEQQKQARAQLITNTIMRSSKDEVKDLALLLSGLAGSTTELDTAFRKARNSFGEQLVPGLTALLNVGTDVLKLMNDIPGPVKAATVALAGMGALILGGAGVLHALTLLKPALAVLFAPPAGLFLAGAAAVVVLGAAGWAKIREESEKTGKALEDLSKKTGLTVKALQEGRIVELETIRQNLLSEIRSRNTALTVPGLDKRTIEEVNAELKELYSQLESTDRTLAAIRRGGGVLGAENIDKETKSAKDLSSQIDELTKKAIQLRDAQERALKTPTLEDNIKINKEIEEFTKSSQLAQDVWTALGSQVKEVAKTTRETAKDFKDVLKDFAGGGKFALPRGGEVGARAAIRNNLPHDGLDVVVAGGRVFNPFEDAKVLGTGFSNIYGNYVKLALANGRELMLGHFKSIAVQANQVLNQGAFIGLQGSTGRSTGPHLHIGLKVNGKTVFDPQQFRAELVALAQTGVGAFYDAVGQSVSTKGSDPLISLFAEQTRNAFQKALQNSTDARLAALKTGTLSAAVQARDAGNFEKAAEQANRYRDVIAEIGRREEERGQKAKKSAEEQREANRRINEALEERKFKATLENASVVELLNLRQKQLKIEADVKASAGDRIKALGRENEIINAIASKRAEILKGPLSPGLADFGGFLKTQTANPLAFRTLLGDKGIADAQKQLAEFNREFAATGELQRYIVHLKGLNDQLGRTKTGTEAQRAELRSMREDITRLIEDNSVKLLASQFADVQKKFADTGDAVEAVNSIGQIGKAIEQLKLKTQDPTTLRQLTLLQEALRVFRTDTQFNQLIIKLNLDLSGLSDKAIQQRVEASRAQLESRFTDINLGALSKERLEELKKQLAGVGITGGAAIDKINAALEKVEATIQQRMVASASLLEGRFGSLDFGKLSKEELESLKEQLASVGVTTGDVVRRINESLAQIGDPQETLNRELRGLSDQAIKERGELGKDLLEARFKNFDFSKLPKDSLENLKAIFEQVGLQSSEAFSRLEKALQRDSLRMVQNFTNAQDALRELGAEANRQNNEIAASFAAIAEASDKLLNELADGLKGLRNIPLDFGALFSEATGIEDPINRVSALEELISATQAELVALQRDAGRAQILPEVKADLEARIAQLEGFVNKAKKVVEDQKAALQKSVQDFSTSLANLNQSAADQAEAEAHLANEASRKTVQDLSTFLQEMQQQVIETNRGRELLEKEATREDRRISGLRVFEQQQNAITRLGQSYLELASIKGQLDVALGNTKAFQGTIDKLDELKRISPELAVEVDEVIAQFLRLQKAAEPIPGLDIVNLQISKQQDAITRLGQGFTQLESIKGELDTALGNTKPYQSTVERLEELKRVSPELSADIDDLIQAFLKLQKAVEPIPGLDNLNRKIAEQQEALTRLGQSYRELDAIKLELDNAIGNTQPYDTTINRLEELKRISPELGAEIDELIQRFLQLQRLSLQSSKLSQNLTLSGAEFDAQIISVEEYKQRIQETIQTYQGWIDSGKETKERVRELRLEVERLKGTLKGLDEDTNNAFQELQSKVASGLLSVFNSIKSFAAAFDSDTLSKGIGQALGAIGDLVGLIPGGQVIAAGIKIGGFFIEGIVEGLDGGRSKVQAEIKQLASNLQLIDKSVFDTAKTFEFRRSFFFGGFYEKLDELKVKITQSIAQALEGGVLGGLRNSIKGFLEGTADIYSGLKAGIRDAIIAGITEAVIQGAIIKGALGGLLTQLTEALAKGDFGLAGQLIQGIANQLPALAASLEQLLAPLKNSLKGLAPLSGPGANREISLSLPPSVQVAIYTPLFDVFKKLDATVDKLAGAVDRLVDNGVKAKAEVKVQGVFGLSTAALR